MTRPARGKRAIRGGSGPRRGTGAQAADHGAFMYLTRAVLTTGRNAPRISLVDNGAAFRGVIIDWHGVLTPPLRSTIQAWVEADGIDWDSYVAVVRGWISQAYDTSGARNPIHA